MLACGWSPAPILAWVIVNLGPGEAFATMPADWLTTIDLRERSAERSKESSSNCRALLSRRMARLPTSKKVFDVGSETWANPHGTSRQDELTQCEPGEPVRLLLEANNPHDPGAVLVVSDRGVGLGYWSEVTRRSSGPSLAAVGLLLQSCTD